jgi:hypothetical protein
MEFEINGQAYRCGKMDAFKQFHVSRRLAPVFGGLASSASKDNADFSQFLQPIAEAVAHMLDADCDYVLQACLGVTQRKQESGWANVYNVQTKALMFSDVDLAVMLQITAKVIQDNLGGFFQGAVAGLNPSTTA